MKNLCFTRVLNVQHVQSDEKVARRSDKFAFYHSFERPTHEVTTGSIGDVRNLRFTTALSVRHAGSDEMVVKSTGAIPAPQTEKEYILTLFQTTFISNLFSAVFSLNLEQLEVVYQQWGSGIPKNI